jgi:hypothetical protein
MAYNVSETTKQHRKKKNKSRRIKFKRKKQIWLRACQRSEDRRGRRKDENREVKFKRKEQAWLKTCKMLKSETNKIVNKAKEVNLEKIYI